MDSRLWGPIPLKKTAKKPQKLCAKRGDTHEYIINISLVAEAQTSILQVACKE
jgi:hypothetical protein